MYPLHFRAMFESYFKRNQHSFSFPFFLWNNLFNQSLLDNYVRPVDDFHSYIQKMTGPNDYQSQGTPYSQESFMNIWLCFTTRKTISALGLSTQLLALLCQKLWWQKLGATLAQVMAPCCLTEPCQPSPEQMLPSGTSSTIYMRANSQRVPNLKLWNDYQRSRYPPISANKLS